MVLDQVAREGLVLLGCGKMGSALLAGWLDAGLPAGSVWVIEPNPTEWLPVVVKLTWKSRRGDWVGALARLGAAPVLGDVRMAEIPE